MARIFVSYARSTRAAVERVVADVRASGHDASFDNVLAGGQNWWNELLATAGADLVPDRVERSGGVAGVAVQGDPTRHRRGAPKPGCRRRGRRAAPAPPTARPTRRVPAGGGRHRRAARITGDCDGRRDGRSDVAYFRSGAAPATPPATATATPTATATAPASEWPTGSWVGVASRRDQAGELPCLGHRRLRGVRADGVGRAGRSDRGVRVVAGRQEVASWQPRGSAPGLSSGARVDHRRWPARGNRAHRVDLHDVAAFVSSSTRRRSRSAER